MTSLYTPTTEARYYNQPTAFRCTFGGTAITTFPAASGNTNGVGSNATGSVALSGNLAAGDILNFNGTPVTFVTSGAVGLQVNVGATAYQTLASLMFLLLNTTDLNINKAYYSISNLTLNITAAVPGTAGTAYTLTKTNATNATLSGANLSGGTAVSAGIGILVPPNYTQPQEIQYLWCLARGNQSANVIYLVMSDYTTITTVDVVTVASAASVTTSQGNSRVSFTNISKDTPVAIPPGNGLFLYSAQAQTWDAFAGPAGVL